MIERSAAGLVTRWSHHIVLPSSRQCYGDGDPVLDVARVLVRLQLSSPRVLARAEGSSDEVAPYNALPDPEPVLVTTT